MRYILCILFFGINLFSHAQTKKIAFRSHSGNVNDFRLAFETGIGDTDNSNFGMAPEPIVRTAQLDSVILLCDTAAVMITSEYCRNRRSQTGKETKWKAGKDTVYRHPLFNSHLSLDSIRTILRTQYYFNNPGKTVFIGFEEPITMNRNPVEMKIGIIPSNQNDHFDNDLLLITSLIFGLALLGGLFAWHISTPKKIPTRNRFVNS